MTSETTPELADQKRKAQLVSFFTLFLDLFGFGIIIPVQSYYAISLGAAEHQVTWLSAVYSLMQFLFVPIWGAWSDRIGRKPIVMMSVAIAAIGHFWFSQSTTLTGLFLARAIAGFGNANIAAAQAIVADVTSERDRAKGMGMLGAAFGLGFVLGPAVGGILAQYGPTVPAIAAGILSIANLIFAATKLPETLSRPNSTEPLNPYLKPAKAQHEYAWTVGSRWTKIEKQAQGLMMLGLAFTISFTLMEMVTSLLIGKYYVQTDSMLDPERFLAGGSRLLAYFMIAVGITMVIIQGKYIGPMVKTFGEKRLMVSGMIITAVGISAMPFLASTIPFFGFLGTAVVVAIGSGCFTPSLSSMLSKLTSSQDQGLVLGLNQSLSSLGRFIGPFIAGGLFEMWTPLPYVLGAAGLVFALTIWGPALRQRL